MPSYQAAIWAAEHWPLTTPEAEPQIPILEELPKTAETGLNWLLLPTIWIFAIGN
jgi:hypothetical protein